MPFAVIKFIRTLLSNKTHVVKVLGVSNVSKLVDRKTPESEKGDQLSKKKHTCNTLLIEICKNEKFNGKHENDSDCII